MESETESKTALCEVKDLAISRKSFLVNKMPGHTPLLGVLNLQKLKRTEEEEFERTAVSHLMSRFALNEP